MSKEFDPKQREAGWVCPECGMTRGSDLVDPCLGKLPGILFACCGHGGLTAANGQGYLYFENGVRIGLLGPILIDRYSEDEIQRSKECKERTGQ